MVELQEEGVNPLSVYPLSVRCAVQIGLQGELVERFATIMAPPGPALCNKLFDRSDGLRLKAEGMWLK